MFQLKTKAIIILLLIPVVLSSLTAYGQIEEKMDMYGRITKIIYDEQGKLDEIHIENINKNNKPYDKVVVIVSDNTRFINRNIETDKLYEEQTLGIIFKDGPITMIYPARIEAELVSIEDNEVKPGSENEDIVSANNQRIVEEDRQALIMQEFNELLQMENNTIKVLDFIDNNISLLSEENASQMINEFEKYQKNCLPNVEEKFYDNELQKRIYKVFQDGFNLSKVNDINEVNKLNDPDLKELLIEIRNSGYKVETAEGMFFPIIDYKFYQQYSPYLSTDMGEYIRIMSVESQQAPAKDAALVIKWAEVVKRALSQEEFIIKHPDSLKIVDMKDLYQKYLNFIFFGLNNTPLFSYDSNMMVTEARNTYLETVNSKGVSNSKLLESLMKFLELLETNNYKLTDEVEEYRENTAEDILFTYNSTEKNSKEIIADNYGDSTELTQILNVYDSEIQFDILRERGFSGNFKGYYTAGKSYPYYLDAAMGGQRGIHVKDNFGVWHSFSYRVNIFD